MKRKIQKTQATLTLEENDLADHAGISDYIAHLIHDNNVTDIVVDLSAFHYLNSAQIGTLVSMHLTAYENVAVIRFSNAHARVAELLRLAGVDRLLELHHGKEVADESLGGEPGATGR